MMSIDAEQDFEMHSMTIFALRCIVILADAIVYDLTQHNSAPHRWRLVFIRIYIIYNSCIPISKQ